jgi:hypothetical protein
VFGKEKTVTVRKRNFPLRKRKFGFAGKKIFAQAMPQTSDTLP